MKQRAIQSGVVHAPVYQFIEAGQEFEHHELLKWAIPIGSLEPGAGSVIIDDKPAAPAPEPIAAPRKRSAKASDAAAEDLI